MDGALVHLIAIYGLKKWADIARQMKTVYGYVVTPSQVGCRWSIINPQRNSRNWTAEENNQIWGLFITYEDDYPKIASYHPQRSKFDIGIRLFYIMRNSLRFIDKMFNMERAINFVYVIKKKVFLYLIKLNKQSPIKDSINEDQEFYSNVVQSSKRFVFLITMYCEMLAKQFTDQDMFKEMAKHMTKEEFRQMLSHIYHLKIMHDIYYKFFDPFKSDIKKEEELQPKARLRCKLEREFKCSKRKSKVVTSWADALSEPEKSQSEDNSDHNMDPERKLQFQHYGIEDIDKIKRSLLYQRLFHNEYQMFFNMYNQALEPKNIHKNIFNYEDFEEKQELDNQKVNEDDEDEFNPETEIKKAKKKIIRGKKYKEKSAADAEIKIVKTKYRKSMKMSKDTFRTMWTRYRDEDFKTELQEAEDNIKQHPFKMPKLSKIKQQEEQLNEGNDIEEAYETMFKKQEHTNMRLQNPQQAKDSLVKLAFELFDK